MKALAICHKTRADLGVLEKILEDRGFEIDVHLGHWNSLKDLSPSTCDLLIFMGGPMGVYQADIFPYLMGEIEFLKRYLETGKPYLGICLGAQLLAAALGSEVYVAPKGKEIGWYDIQVNEAGKKTALRYFDQEETKMMEWHGDTFDLPEGGKLLASSELYSNQAFSYNDTALGLQFHPEVTMHNIELWLGTAYQEVERNNMTVPGLREMSMQNIKGLNKQTTLFFNEWLDEVL